MFFVQNRGGKKHMKTTSKSKVEKEEQYHKGYCKAVEDICNSLKALDSQKAVLKKNK